MMEEKEKLEKKKKSGLGIAGFSLSIIAFIFAFAGWAGTILAIISLGLAAAGFLTARRKNKGRKLAVAGAAISVGAVLLSIPFMSMWTGENYTAALVYGDYNYSPQSMLIEDDLLYESVNPLVSVTGFLAFEVPTEVANSDEPCSLVVTTWDGESVSFDLG